MPIRCVIVEDQEMFAQLVGGLLRSSCDLEILEIAGTLADGLAAIDHHRPSLLILDLELPDGSGLVAAEHLFAVAPHARVVVLSAQACQFVCPAALQQAVIAVVDKTQAWEVLVDQVATYVRDSGIRSPSLAPLERCSSLTDREREVLRRLGQGAASKVIAHDLVLSVSTVETHRRNIAAKLGISGAELIRLAVLYNLSEPPP